MEGVNINKSLMTLKMVLREMGKPLGRRGKPPTKDSALTKVLENALTGHQLCAMLAAVHAGPRDSRSCPVAGGEKDAEAESRSKPARPLCQIEVIKCR